MIGRSTGKPRVFFFNDTATTEIYTLSLHDALPIYQSLVLWCVGCPSLTVGEDFAVRTDSLRDGGGSPGAPDITLQDRKSTRLNSSHANISYAVFCLKKKDSSYPLSLRSSPSAPQSP